MFLLRPSPEVNNCIRYCLALAQRRSKVRVHSVTFLSNHYHLVVTDDEGLLPVFSEELNKLVARALNSKLSRRENFWEANKPTSYVRLASPDDVLAKTVYTLANPTAALLVARGTEWPGVRLYRHGRYRARRPSFFFRGASGDTEVLPETVDLELTPPPLAGDDREANDIVKNAVQARERELRQHAKLEGKRFLGAAKVLKQEITQAPTHTHRLGAMSPRVACRDRWRRAEALQRLDDFAIEYEECRRRFCQGETEVVFPVGTYRIVRQFGARCADA